MMDDLDIEDCYDDSFDDDDGYDDEDCFADWEEDYDLSSEDY